jgi:peptide chain release factor 2
LNKLENKLTDLKQKSLSEDFWFDPNQAKKINKEIVTIEKEIKDYKDIEKKILEAKEIINFIKSEGQKAHDFSNDLKQILLEIEKALSDLEFKKLLGGKFDKNNAILSIQAGQGGIDAQEWTGRLLKMYTAYCQKRGWTVNLIDESFGPMGHLKEVSVEIIGEYAFGYLKKESGVHRLVRISPFSPNDLRHTSFALVEVIPDLGDLPPLDIKPEDLKIDTFKASGPGGQYVNKTESAVRITHLPTGITVSCKSERHQAANKEKALHILHSKLYNLMESQKQNTLDALKVKVRPEWGNQIRSYIFNPYQLIKDHRTGYEAKNIEYVLEGGLDGFIDAELKND